MKTEQEFEVIGMSYAPLIKKTIRYIGLQQDYQEAYQMGLIALWEAWRDFDPQKGYFPAYAKAKITGRLKTFSTKSKIDLERYVLFSNSYDLIQEIDETSDWHSLDLETVKLSGKEKLWIKEFVIEGFNTEEMAKRHRVSTHTVRSWKKGVKRKLKIHFFNSLKEQKNGL